MPYITSEEAYLMHHGVKGMKWGVRKQRSSGGSKMGAGRKALMTVGNAAMHIPGAKAAVNTGWKKAGLNTTVQKEKAKLKEANVKAGKALTKTTAAKVGQQVGKKMAANKAEKEQAKAEKESLGTKVKKGAKGAVDNAKAYVNKPLTERVGADIKEYNRRNKIAGAMYVGSFLATVAGKQGLADFMSTVGDSTMISARKEVENAIKADIAISAGKVAVKGTKAAAGAVKQKQQSSKEKKRK